MVNDSGQLYTIEGVAAGILMIVTAYLVVSTTTVLTPQDVHIIDMQLEQLGNDVLAMMDTPDQNSDQYGSIDARKYSSLTMLIRNASNPDAQSEFQDQFLFYVNSATNTDNDRLNYSASISYVTITNQINTKPFGGSTYYRENAVKVTRWVYLPKGTVPYLDMNPNVNQTVLLEVLLWRE